MADLKTTCNDASVEEFLEGFPEDNRKKISYGHIEEQCIDSSTWIE